MIVNTIAKKMKNLKKRTVSMAIARNSAGCVIGTKCLAKILLSMATPS